MKLKTNFKKIIAAFILIMIISSAFIGNFNSVYGRVNEVYKTSGEVGSIDVEQAVSDSTVLEAIARMIYAIAGFIENVVGGLVSIFTGEKMFPWADRVIFNTMPMIDVNFLSPSRGSMFAKLNGDPTDLGVIIRNIYYTVFTLAVTFFGVVVGIMALRLAISSIASEKAKYKQAITNWLLALILIFTAHYLMSFVFFVNEKMVEVASSMVTSQNISFKNIDTSKMTPDEIREFCKAIMSEALAGWSYDQTYNTESSIIFYNPNVVLDANNFDSIKELVKDDKSKKNLYGNNIFSLKWGDNGDTDEWGIKYFKDFDSWKEFDGEWEATGKSHSAWMDCLMNLYSDGSYRAGLDIKDHDNTYVIFTDSAYILNLLKYHNLENGGVSKEDFIQGISNLAAHINYYSINYSPTSDEIYDVYDDIDTEGNDKAREEHFEKLWQHVDKTYLGNSGNYKEEVFTGMADFFKNAVTAISTTKDEDGELVIIDFNAIPAILYSIFVIQSIMYFIAYMKRFFYIIVLALFAPIVIIYDFLMKTAMG